MAEEHKTQFDAYRVRYRTGGEAIPEIECLYHGDLVGRLHFHGRDAEMPTSELLPEGDGGVVCLHFTLSQFPHLIDLLREEKPLYLWFSASRREGAVMTGAEPVGEGEPYLSR